LCNFLTAHQHTQAIQCHEKVEKTVINVKKDDILPVVQTKFRDKRHKFTCWKFHFNYVQFIYGSLSCTLLVSFVKQGKCHLISSDLNINKSQTEQKDVQTLTSRVISNSKQLHTEEIKHISSTGQFQHYRYSEIHLEDF